MLSYMVPSIEDKGIPKGRGLELELGPEGLPPPHPPPPAPLPNGHHHQLPPQPPHRRIIKTHSKSSTLSAESSASSLSSVLSEAQPSNPKSTTINNNNNPKHPTLKRVSFGSSKGSMVETLIYESPLQEEPEPSPSAEQTSLDSSLGSDSGRASKVRVTFFECEKPQLVSSPEPADLEEAATGGEGGAYAAAMAALANRDSTDASFNRQTSTDSGWDNPFRPDGDLSREADEIVELIKGGKPITPTPGSEAPKLPSVEENGCVPDGGTKLQPASPDKKNSPVKSGATNRGAPSPNGTAEKPVVQVNEKGVEVQRATVVPPTDASQVEHVTLKKKPKCKCCVIQ